MLRFALMCLITGSTLVARGDDDAEKRRKMREDFARQQELAKPGDEHARLKRLTGQWDVSMMLRGNPIPFQGKAEAKTILDDRFLVIDGAGKYATQEGTAFRYTIGFDRRHDEYTITLMDTAGTYSVHARGKAVDGMIRMHGTDDDPRMKAMGLGEKKFAFDLDIAGDDEFLLTTLYIDNRSGEDKPVGSIEYRFRRQKGEQD